MNNKQIPLEKLSKITKELNSENKIIVFTHGVFDTIHSGHRFLLEESKNMGDVLIVGLESDERAKYFKGKSNLRLNYKERLLAISKIQCVDYIFQINSATRGNLEKDTFIPYKTLKPHIITYGNKFGFASTIETHKSLFPETKFKQITSLYQYSPASLSIS